MSKLSLGVYIISWEGFGQRAAKIAESIQPHVDSLHVIYSNQAESDEHGAGQWHKVPNAWFFGKKFETAINLCNEDIFLLIHADVDTSNWQLLAERCHKVMSFNDMGVWVPDINYSPWPVGATSITDVSNLPHVYFVANTDAIVVAYSKDVISRLKKYNYEVNNYGHGIDWAAVCYAYVNNKLVLGDQAVKVSHTKTDSYNKTDAKAQMALFFKQMTVQERMQYSVLNGFIRNRNSQYLAGT